MVQGLKYRLVDQNSSGTKLYIPGYWIYYNIILQNSVFSINDAVSIDCPYGKK